MEMNADFKEVIKSIVEADLDLAGGSHEERRQSEVGVVVPTDTC